MELDFDIKTNRDNFKKDVAQTSGGIYFLYDKGGQLLYIGKAINFRNRFECYWRGKNEIARDSIRELFNTFYYINLLLIDNHVKRDETERQYIAKFKPPCNTIGTGRNSLPDRCLVGDSNTRILIIIPKELKEELEKKAKENNRSVSNYIVTLIKKDVAAK